MDCKHQQIPNNINLFTVFFDFSIRKRGDNNKTSSLSQHCDARMLDILFELKILNFIDDTTDNLVRLARKSALKFQCFDLETFVVVPMYKNMTREKELCLSWVLCVFVYYACVELWTLSYCLNFKYIYTHTHTYMLLYICIVSSLR